MRNGVFNLLFSLLLFYPLAWIFHIQINRDKSKTSLSLFLNLSCVYLFSHRLFPHVFNFFPGNQ